jgi:PBSX family phage terminase large subunit
MSRTINLGQCFPEGRDGTKQPLPKQRQFLDALLDERPGAPKYVRYVGGIGSGKTLIGCITMVHLAVLRPGDYLIARQFMPELKDTTYKTFLEVCPPELIAEIRVADMVVKIRNIVGGVSTILFRGLEEPDKLRSLNLNAFYIDEANQVSEAAFMLLQGRLRGKHWRKGFLTMNPGGHDWSWRWFVRQDHIENPEVRRLFLNIRAPSLENVHLPDGYIDTMMASWSSERIKREIMGSDDVFEGQIYNEFDRSLHVVKPFRVPDDWTIRIGCDDGYRNAAAWVYLAVSPEGDCYAYDEFYEKEWLIEEIAKKGKDGRPSAITKLGSRKVEQARMDPAAKQVKDGRTNWDAYLEHLPKGFPLLEANKAVSAGIDRVKSYLKPDKNGRPRLYIFETCHNLLDEIAQYKWKPQAVSQEGKADVKEEPVKHNDHACDALRYVIMTMPEPTPKTTDPADRLKRGTLERALYNDLKKLKNPIKSADPFND